MRQIAMFVFILCASATCTVAQPAKAPCGSSAYKLPLDFISLGMSTTAVKAAVKAKHPNMEVVEDAQKIIFIFPRDQAGTFDSFAAGLTNGRVTRLILSYSETFQQTFGSLSGAFLAVAKRLVEKYGKAAESDEKDDGFDVTWAENGGMEMQLSSGAPHRLMLVLTCDTLVTEIREQATKSVNFGI